MKPTFLKFAHGRGSDYPGDEGLVITPQRMVVVGDASTSMQGGDFPPSRYGGLCEAVTAMIQVKLQGHPEDALGIVAFGDDAKCLHPVVNVRENVASLCAALPSSGCLGGTNIGSGIDLAVEMLTGSPTPRTQSTFLSRAASLLYGEKKPTVAAPPYDSVDRMMIVLTDGEDYLSEDLPGSAKAAKKLGITICTIGIGGDPSAVDEPTLKKIASKDASGNPMYCFIRDQLELVNEFKRLGALRRL